MTDSVKKNIKSGKIISISAYLLGAFAFLTAWYISDIFWYLLAGLLLLTACVLFLFLFKWIEKRLNGENR